jgi:hypothetical protein
MVIIKSILVILLIVLAIIFGIRTLTPEDSWICENGAWLRHGNPASPMPTSACAIVNTTPTVSISSEQNLPTPTVNSSNLKEYDSLKMKFSTKYPLGTDVNENLDGTVSFVKWGPTQKTQTELFDGFSVNIDRGSLGTNSSLKSLIDADIEQKIAQLSPDFKIIKPVSPYALWTKTGGLYYVSEGPFGLVTYYYLPQTDNNFLLLSVIVKDPGKNDFQGVVDSIISGIIMTD